MKLEILMSCMHQSDDELIRTSQITGDVLMIKVYRAEGLLDLKANEDAPDGEYIDVEVTLEVIESDAGLVSNE